MAKIADCTHCGACERQCPYDLRPYETLPGQLSFYQQYVTAHR